MNDKQQIEEMARTMGGCHITPNCKTCDEKSGTTSCYNKIGAKNLYNAGYRKIPENAVVLTMTEHAKLVAQIRQEFEVEYKDKVVLTKEEYIELTLAKQSIFKMLDEREDKARRETAEKIYLQAKAIVDATKHIVQGREYLHIDALKEIVKSCGVKIKE